jgi:hypothetical protein
VYVLAPLAVNDVLLPLHIVADDGLIVNVGNAFTVTVVVFVFTQPFPSIPVSVYVVVTVGVTAIVEVVTPPGFHV